MKRFLQFQPVPGGSWTVPPVQQDIPGPPIFRFPRFQDFTNVDLNNEHQLMHVTGFTRQLVQQERFGPQVTARDLRTRQVAPPYYSPPSLQSIGQQLGYTQESFFLRK